jgi:hypothetical protein
MDDQFLYFQAALTSFYAAVMTLERVIDDWGTSWFWVALGVVCMVMWACVAVECGRRFWRTYKIAP